MSRYSWQHTELVPPSGGALTYCPEQDTMLLATVDNGALVQTWRWQNAEWHLMATHTFRSKSVRVFMAHGPKRTLLFAFSGQTLHVLDPARLEEIGSRDCAYDTARFAGFDEGQQKFVVVTSKGRDNTHTTMLYDAEDGTWTDFDSPEMTGGYWHNELGQVVSTGNKTHALAGDTWTPVQGAPPDLGNHQKHLGQAHLAKHPDGRWFCRYVRFTAVREPGEGFVHANNLYLDQRYQPTLVDGKAALWYPSAAEVHRLEDSWTVSHCGGDLPGRVSLYASASGGENLYGLTMNGELWHHAGDQWSQLSTDGPRPERKSSMMGGPNGEFGWPMQVHDGRVYVCTHKQTWVWDDAWTQLSGKVPSGRFGAMVSTPAGLYFCSATAVHRLDGDAWTRVVYGAAFKPFSLTWEPTRNVLIGVGLATVNDVEAEWVCVVEDGAWRPLVAVPDEVKISRDYRLIVVDPADDQLLLLHYGGVWALALGPSLPRDQMPSEKARRKSSMGAQLDNSPPLDDHEQATLDGAHQALASEDLSQVMQGCQALLDLDRPHLISALIAGSICDEYGEVQIGPALATAVCAAHQPWVALRLRNHLGHLKGLSQLNASLTDLDAVQDLALSHVCIQNADTLTDLSPLVERSLSLVEERAHFGARTLDFKAGLATLRIEGCAQLVDLGPLGGLTHLYGVELLGCEALTVVPSLPTTLRLLTLEGAALTHLDDLANLTSLAELRLRNSALTHLSGVSELPLSLLDLTGCHGLVNLDGLPRVHTLILGDNAALENLDGLSRLPLMARLRCLHALGDDPLAAAVWAQVRDDVLARCDALATEASETHWRQLWALLADAPATAIAEVAPKLASWPDALRVVDVVGVTQVLKTLASPVWRLARSAVLDGDLERLPTGLWHACDHLSSLVIAGNGLDDQGLADLATSGSLTGLRSLGVFSRGYVGDYDRAGAKTPITEAGWRSLSGANLPNLTALDLPWNAISVAEIEALLSGPLLSQLDTLSLRNNDLGVPGVVALADNPKIAALVTLNLRCNDLEAQGLAALVASKHLGALRQLDLSENPRLGGLEHAGPLIEPLTALNLSKSLPDGHGASLAKLNLSQLGSLNIAHNAIQESGARALAETQWGALHTLDATVTQLGNEGFAALLHSPLAENLTALKVGDCFVHDPAPLANCSGLTTLDYSSNGASDVSVFASLSELQTLVLARSNIHTRSLGALTQRPELDVTVAGMAIDVASVLALLESQVPKFTALSELPDPGIEGQVLDLSGVLFDDSVVEFIANNPAFACVTDLRLCLGGAGWRESLTARGVAALANSPHLHRLLHLDLSGQGLKADALTALCEGSGLRALRTLKFANNRPNCAALRDLAKSPLLAQLNDLDLSNSELLDSGVISLVQSHHIAAMRRLQLGGNDFGQPAVQALLDSPWLKQLTYLWAQHTNMSKACVKLLETSVVPAPRPRPSPRDWR